MSKNFFLLLVLMASANSNQTFTMENDILANLDKIHEDPKNSSSILGSFFGAISNFAGFGQKEQNTITNKLTKTPKQKEIEPKFFPKPKNISLKEENANIAGKVEIKKEWCGTEIPQQISNRAKTLFGISFDKKELMYFGASAVALITLGGIVYVLYKYKDKNNWTFNWTLQKVSQDMRQFIVDHKTAIKSSIITAVVVAIVALCAKRQGISFESASSWTMNRFVKQSTSTNQVNI